MPPALIGHRGARARHPENTIDGFQAALAAGITWFEIDVGLTLDGVVVLSHDLRLNPAISRDAQGAWLHGEGPAIHSLTAAELAGFDVGRIRLGSEYDRRFPHQQPRDGARIPTLEAALRLDPASRWTIEIKTSPEQPELTAAPEHLAEQVAAVVDRVGAADRVVVQSFDWRGPRHLRRLRPELAYAWLTEPGTAHWHGPGFDPPAAVAAEGGGTWAPRHDALTRALLADARRRGLAVVPWTVDAPDDLRRLAAWGVDGLITDDPVAARAVLHPAELR